MQIDLPPRLYSAVLAALDLAVMKAPLDSLLRVQFDEARRYLEEAVLNRIERVKSEVRRAG